MAKRGGPAEGGNERYAELVPFPSAATAADSEPDDATDLVPVDEDLDPALRY